MRQRGLAAMALLASMAAALPARQQPRDGATAAPVGAGRIMGTVATDEPRPRPLRRARVTLSSIALPRGRTLITGQDGGFVFDRLPPGSYTIDAARDAYVAMSYGARRAGGPGARLLIRRDETHTVTVRLPRGAVITGLVTDPRGEPAAGIRVDAMQYRFSAAAAGRRLRASGTAVTDDRGVYRIFGLAPGDYAIAAPYPASGLVALSETRPPSAADVGRAIAEAQASAVSARPGIPVPVSSGPRPAAPAKYVAPAAVFYPGTTDAAHAGVVTVKAGQEADGVDFALAYVPTATVSGVVTGASPGLARTVSLTRVSEVGRDFARGVPLDAEGRFVFRRVPPGRYAITARAVPPRSASSAPAGIQAYAAAEITVDGDDVAVTMGLQPGIRISGTVAFEGDGTPFPNVGSLSVPMPSVQTASGMAIDLPPARVEPARTVGQVSRFAISGLMAGQFRLTADVPGVRAPVRGWWLKSLVVGGREVLDEPLQMHESVDDAVLTLSDRASELGGLVTDAQRRPAGDVHVVAFSTSPATWFPYSRRIGASRTNAEGRYAIHNLPPGAYFVVASDDVEPGEWFDSAFLAALAPRAVRVHVQGDSQQELNLRSERR